MRDQATTKVGSVKIRLTYLTNQAVTETALFLEKLHKKGPYTEEVWVLVPLMQALSRLEAYEPAFNSLKADHVVPSDAVLIEFAFDPLSTAAAYVMP